MDDHQQSLRYQHILVVFPHSIYAWINKDKISGSW